MMERRDQKRVPSGSKDSAPIFSRDPTRVIARALFDARRRGLDDVSQTRYAVAAVLSVRPDLSPREVTRSVELFTRQDSWPPIRR